MKRPFQATHSKERYCSPIGSIEMSQFVDVIEIGKEKSISNKRAAEMLSSFITANSGNENDTFDENKILDDVIVEQLNQVLAAIPNSE